MKIILLTPFSPLLGPQWCFLALWTPKLQENVISYIILLSASLMCVYVIPTQLEKCLLSYFDFTDFGGHPWGAQFLGCQLQI